MTRRVRDFAFVLFALCALAAHAQLAGRVQFVSGTASVERASGSTALRAKDEVRRGDTLVTGADGLVQLTMIDRAVVSLRSRTRMRIDEYQFDEGPRGLGQAVLFLAAGVMRTFTGEITSSHRERFQMRTPHAHIGIRGSGNILAVFEDTGTFNHTLTGAHSVTSLVDGFERTLVSYPGQTIQVRPGLAPRYVPTPPAILAAAAPVSRSASGGASSGSSAESATTSTAFSGTSGTSSSSDPGGASSSPSSGGSSSGGSSSGGSSSGGTPPPSTADTSPPPATTASAPPTSPLAAGTPASTVTGGLSSPASASSASSSASQAATSAVGSAIVATVNAEYEASVRFFTPLPGGGYAGVIASAVSQDGGVAVLDDAGRLTQLTGAVAGTFISGPGATPAGYADTDYLGTITFNGGQHADAFRSSDGSVILGRWTGGTVTIDDSGQRTTFDLGSRSAPYLLTAYTPPSVLSTFTGSATYSLAGATAPTDAAGHVGSVTSATIQANFGNHTITGAFALGINGASYALTGQAGLTPGDPHFTFASSLSNLVIACSGSCATGGYLGTVNGAFAGQAAQWIGVGYRLNPVRASGGGYDDFVAGTIALNTPVAPKLAPLRVATRSYLPALSRPHVPSLIAIAPVAHAEVRRMR